MDIYPLTHSSSSGWGDLPDLDHQAQLGLVFGGADLLGDDSPVRRLAEHYPTMTLLGCRSSIDQAVTEVDDSELTATLVGFSSARLLARSSKISEPKDSATVGANLARCLNGPVPAGVLLFGDGAGVDANALIEAMRSAFPESTVVAGGLSELTCSTSGRPECWTLVEGQPVTGHVTAVGLYGQIEMEEVADGDHFNFARAFAVAASPMLSMEIAGSTKPSTDAMGWDLPAGSTTLGIGVSESIADYAVTTPARSRTFISES